MRVYACAMSLIRQIAENAKGCGANIARTRPLFTIVRMLRMKALDQPVDFS